MAETKSVEKVSGGNESKTTTVTTTTYTASQFGSLNLSTIRPFAASKPIVVQRSLREYGSRDSTDSGVSKRGSSGAYGGSLSSASAAAAQQASADVTQILTGREKEKKEMQELNRRFTSYIEKVRFLEAQNRKLSDELQKLRDTWGQETERVKQLYEVEMAQLRQLLEDSDKQKGAAEVRATSLEEQLNELQMLLEEANRQQQLAREANEKLSTQMADYDAEISLLRRRCAGIDDEREKWQKEIARLRQDVSRLRADLDTETLNHIYAANEAQSLREQLEFQKSVHESELKELAALAYRDTTQENREYWRSEMAQALRDIQQEYDSKIDVVRNEIESQYSIKMQEARTSNTKDNMELAHIKEENKRLRSQAGDSRSRLPELEARNAQLERELEEIRRAMEEAERDAELRQSQLRADLAACNSTLEDYLKEMQALMDAKLSLELEIHAYRKLLEGEEVRISSSSFSRESSSAAASRSSASASASSTVSASAVQRQQVSTTQQQQQAVQQMSVIKGEMSAKTSYQRTAKGAVSIKEVAQDGSYLTLENTGKKKEEIGEWKLTRDIDNGKNKVVIPIPKGTSLQSGNNNTLTIWAKGSKPADKQGIEAEAANLGIGLEIRTMLANVDGEERATHTQKTTYST